MDRIGIFVGPSGSLDTPRDSVSTPELTARRIEAANNAFLGDDLPPIADYDETWTVDGVYFSRKVYWEGEDTSTVGSYGVQFEPDTDVIVDRWRNC